MSQTSPNLARTMPNTVTFGSPTALKPEGVSTTTGATAATSIASIAASVIAGADIEIPVYFLFDILNTSNPNPIMEVTRDSDDLTMDFTAADLVGSPSAVETWIGAGYGYVSKIYSEEGSVIAEQTVKNSMPVVVRDGAQLLNNQGKPTMVMTEKFQQPPNPETITFFQVSGIGAQDGYYYSGSGFTLNGKPSWEHYDASFVLQTARLEYNGTQWVFQEPAPANNVYWQAAAGNETYPWDAVNWTKVNGTGDGPPFFYGPSGGNWDPSYTASYKNLKISPIAGLGPQIAQFIDNGIAGLTASAATYNSFNDRTIGTRNPNNWLFQHSGLITAPSAFRDGFGTGTWQTPHLIAPNVATVAKHHGASSWAPGVEYWFADANDNVEKLVVESFSDVIGTSDFRVIKFTTEASANIGYYRVLHPDDYLDLGLRYGNTPMIYSRIAKTTFVGDINGISSSISKKVPVDAQRLAFHQTVALGDSADGIYLPVPVGNGQWELILLGHWYSAASGPFISYKPFYDEINAWMAANTTYQLDPIRFKGYGQSGIWAADPYPYGNVTRELIQALLFGNNPDEAYMGYVKIYDEKNVNFSKDISRLTSRFGVTPETNAQMT